MTSAQIDTAEFAVKLQTWIDACDAQRQAYHSKHYPTTFAQRGYALEQEVGKRYIRIVDVEYNRETGATIARSAFAFIDTTNGNVLKPASWKSPAKHARGNIFDATNGTGTMTQYGPAYLR